MGCCEPGQCSSVLRHLAAHLLQRLDSLRARVVELARLPDGEAARAEQQHLLHGGRRRRVGDRHGRALTGDAPKEVLEEEVRVGRA
jgi:hypothetical protein